MEKNNIKKIIDKKKVVSFDIFDTLLFRNIYKPTDIFKIMEKEVSEQYQIDGFHDLRIKCEAESRNEKNKYETSLDEIYQLIEEKTGKNVDKIKKREIELELEFIDKNPFMQDIFNYALKQGKKVVLISDMYLPSEIVKKLLKKAGYTNVPVYISCEHHANKGTTELYKLVCRKEKFDKDAWVHIGDNKYSDYDKAKEFGAEAILYTNVRTKDTLKEPESIELSIVRGIQNNYLYNGNEVEYWDKFGVLYASPVYYGLTNWLFGLTKNKDNLFFLARDGYIVKKIYDLFKEKENSKINTYYLYCSRKTFQLPAFLHKSQDEAVDFLCAFTNDYEYKITIDNILNNLGLKYNDYREVLEVFGFDNKDARVTSENYLQVRKFLKYAFDDISSKLRESEKRVLKYLKQEDVLKYDKMNIMDVGWGGSIQEALRLLTNKKVMGFYLGTIPTSKVDIMSNSLGFAFDEAKPDDYYQKIFNYPMMYEFIFSAPHGTTIDLKEEKGKIVPVLDDDDEEYARIVNIMQDGALKVLKVFLSYSKYLNNLSVKDSISNYDDMIERRDYEDLCEFAKLTNSVIYTNNKNTYIKEYDESYIYENFEEFKEKNSKAMWKNSYFVKGIETREQWDAHRARFIEFEKRYYKDLRNKKIKRVLGGIKHPKKAAVLIAKKIIG